MTPGEAYEEERMVTIAEYGAETAAEFEGTTEADPGTDTKHNFHYNLWELPKGGAKTRYKWNVDAIRTLKQIESEGRLAIPQEQKALSNYVGWGGLATHFHVHGFIIEDCTPERKVLL